MEELLITQSLLKQKCLCVFYIFDIFRAACSSSERRDVWRVREQTAVRLGTGAVPASLCWVPVQTSCLLLHWLEELMTSAETCMEKYS